MLIMCQYLHHLNASELRIEQCLYWGNFEFLMELGVPMTESILEAIAWSGKRARDMDVYCPLSQLMVRVFLLRLFNIEEDPRETEDVSDNYPHIVEKLLLKLSDYYVSLLTPKLLRKCYYVIISNAFKDVQATPYYPEEDPRANPKNNNGVWGAWIKE